MRKVSEYLSRAAEFATLASNAANESLQRRYLDLAECYRLLAAERERLIAQGEITPLPE
jgi:hypothetical protein